MRTLSRRKMMTAALLSIATLAFATPRVEAASAASLDANVAATLRDFHRHVRGTRELVADAAAVLVFPTVIKAGMGIGGEYGEGELLARGRPPEYYNTASASFGFQLGAQARSIIIVFMTEEALADFKRVSTGGKWALTVPSR
jgi:lipid-binding SYLF domain-containing protein